MPQTLAIRSKPSVQSYPKVARRPELTPDHTVINREELGALAGQQLAGDDEVDAALRCEQVPSLVRRRSRGDVIGGTSSTKLDLGVDVPQQAGKPWTEVSVEQGYRGLGWYLDSEHLYGNEVVSGNDVAGLGPVASALQRLETPSAERPRGILGEVTPEIFLRLCASYDVEQICGHRRIVAPQVRPTPLLTPSPDDSVTLVYTDSANGFSGCAVGGGALPEVAELVDGTLAAAIAAFSNGPG